MDVKVVWLFVFTVFSKVILTSSFDTKIGHFQVLRPHFEIRKCANEMLQHDELVGMRISHLTGDCEGLSHSWGRNQTTEIGYGYMKKISVQKTFEPPAEVPKADNNTEEEFSYRNRDVWTIIPGILNAGARIDLHLTGDIDQAKYRFVLSEEDARNRAKFVLTTNYIENRIGVLVTGSDSHQNKTGFPDALYSSNELKMSFVAQNTSLQVLFDDKVWRKVNMTGARLNYLTRVSAYRTSNKISDGLFTRRFEFSEA